MEDNRGLGTVILLNFFWVFFFGEEISWLGFAFGV